MNFLHRNDKKRIKSALNDKKRNGVKLTIERSIFWRDKLHLKNCPPRDKNLSPDLILRGDFLRGVISSVYLYYN